MQLLLEDEPELPPDQADNKKATAKIRGKNLDLKNIGFNRTVTQ
jgi:hypothetical protein